MSFIRNLLALVGVIAIASGIFFYGKLAPEIAAFKQLDPGAKDVYLTMWEKLKETGNSADATVWKFPLEEGVSWEDAQDAMETTANGHNIKNVGVLPLSEQVELMTGEKQPFLKIYQYCDPLVAMQMVKVSGAYAAYLPCRISMVEEKDGQIWLYALNMDMMIEGGKTLPDDLLAEAKNVRTVILDIMKRGAAGDF
jgi:uncharacterized protein (DUF302 family)